MILRTRGGPSAALDKLETTLSVVASQFPPGPLPEQFDTDQGPSSNVRTEFLD